MYRILLVDDEKIIREGVHELLTMADLDLDVTTAASAPEAVDILEKQKIDIVITDIRMPQMSGLELYDIIRLRWPMCKMVFLTGHLEFDYVYKVHKHARYVLKAEEDEKILEALREAIQDIENDLLLEQVSLDRSKHQHRNKYYERMLLLKELVEGTTSSSCLTQESLDQMWADIDIAEPVYCVMVRCPAIRQLDYVRQAEVGERMSLLMDKFFLENWRGNFYGYNKHLTYLLLQRKDNYPQEQAMTFMEACSETFQKAVEKNLGLSVSIFIHKDPVDVHQAIRNFGPIRDRMVAMTEDEICIRSLEKEAKTETGALPEDIRQELSRKVQQLENQFDNMDRAGILTTIRQIRQQVHGVASLSDLFVLELYCSICARLISYAKKVGMSEDAAKSMGIINLYNMAQYKSWDDAFFNVKRVVQELFAHVDTSTQHKNEDVINKVKSYIKSHLDGDTSLYTLSNHVHLCPEHLLRVFKKQENVTILQYINDIKLEKAKQMLAKTDTPIKDIAAKLGFASAGYFGRFFKSKIGMTPNVYREQKHQRS